MGINSCPICLEKQRKIDELTEENQRLRAALGRESRKAQEGLFGSSTPSSKLPVKPNSPVKSEKGKPGARPGHKGAGPRNGADAAPIVEVATTLETCPDCGQPLRDKGYEEREVLESRPVKVERTIYRLPKRYCPHCQKSHQTKAPVVLPRGLYGNQLIANAAVMHYLNGIPMGRICEHTGVGAGSLVEILHRLSRFFAQVPARLIEEYRQAPVKHADETGWRANGKNGYAWLFATPQISIFQFGKSRSAKVPQAIFGKEPLPGTLVVDRYSAYNKLPCAIQYCNAHLLREIQDLEKDFPDQPEIKTFVATTAPMLSLAMGLRSQNISDQDFYSRAAQLKKDIQMAMDSPARHLAIRRIQDIFRQNHKRLFIWADDRRVPADNNLAERDLRPSVIARKTSFGSITDAGASTRSTLTSILQSIKKQGHDVTPLLKAALDHLAAQPSAEPYHLLFPRPAPNHCRDVAGQNRPGYERVPGQVPPEFLGGNLPRKQRQRGKKKPGRIPKGNRYVKTLLCEAAQSARRTASQFKEIFEGLVNRRGYKRAIIAVGRRILETGYLMLKRKEPYRDRSPHREELLVRKNAPRWVRALRKYGYLPSAEAKQPKPA